MNKKLLSALLLISVALTSCTSPHHTTQQDGPPHYYRNVSLIHDPTPHYLPKSAYGNPASYTVARQTYHVLASAHGYDQRGIGSWYGEKFSGRLTSTRELYDPYAMTAASPTLPIPCYARVTNLENGHSIIVKVNDRGPFAPNRIIDLSYAAAIKLGYQRKGTALVEVAAIDTNNPNALNIAPTAHKLNHPELYLQVGVFTQYPHANHLQKQLAVALSKKAFIETASHHHRKFYHVELGPLRGVSEADDLQARLKRAGFHDAISVVR